MDFTKSPMAQHQFGKKNVITPTRKNFLTENLSATQKVRRNVAKQRSVQKQQRARESTTSFASPPSSFVPKSQRRDSEHTDHLPPVRRRRPSTLTSAASTTKARRRSMLAASGPVSGRLASHALHARSRRMSTGVTPSQRGLRRCSTLVDVQRASEHRRSSRSGQSRPEERRRGSRLGNADDVVALDEVREIDDEQIHAHSSPTKRKRTKGHRRKKSRMKSRRKRSKVPGQRRRKSKMPGKKKRRRRKAKSGLNLTSVAEEDEHSKSEATAAQRESLRLRRSSSARMLAAMERYHSVMERGQEDILDDDDEGLQDQSRRETYVSRSSRRSSNVHR